MSVDVSKIGGIGAYYYENCKNHGDKIYLVSVLGFIVFVSNGTMGEFTP